MSEYEDLDAQLRAWLDEDEAVATKPWGLHWRLHGPPGRLGVSDADMAEPLILDACDDGTAEYCVHFQPRRVLADIAGKRALLDHVADWPHEYVDGDTWFSCSQAESPNVGDDFAGPGSGCADEKRAGKPCDCGLDKRRLAVLRCVAAGYVARDGFKPEWRIEDEAAPGSV